MSMKVLLCDTAEGLAQLQYALLKSGEDLQTDVVTDGVRAVESAARTQPKVVVAEIGLDGLAGAELVRRLIATVPEARVICWTTLPSPFTAAEMLGVGASGYLLKEDGPEAVARAIMPVLGGNVVISPRIAEQIGARFGQAVRHEREMESALADTSEQLDLLTSAKAEFLANVSHELRTPVTVAKGIAYVLKHRGIPDDEREEFLEKLEGSLEKLMTLVDELLTIAELDRGTLLLQLVETDLAPIVRHVADDMARRYPAVTIEQAVPEHLLAVADQGRISEVVRQLIDNACRYSPEAGAVQVRARTMDEGVVVSITDHGQGMAREIAMQAFNQPFSTGEEILRKERSGIGLGLHMARQLIVQHGGVIWADPLPAGGTRVSFCLPVTRGERLTEPPPITADVEAPALRPVPRPALEAS
ncbi:MAG TPA: ATP-binding protein [Actinomycetota bacterium]|nr:ATP-binding protein [Actinomycetota bacterium]